MAERDLYYNQYEEKIYEILDNSLIFHLPTIEFLIKQRDWDALNLFVVYIYFSKKQRNSKRVWVSNEFARRNMKWRKKRLLEVKRRLVEYGIIKVVPYKEKSPKSKGMVVKKWFVEIKPLLNADNVLNVAKSSEVPKTPDLRGSHSSPLSNGNHSSIQITSLVFNSNNNNSSKEELSAEKSADGSSPPFSKQIKVIRRYFEHHFNHLWDKKPIWEYGKEDVLVRRFLKVYSLEDAFDLIDAFFASDKLNDFPSLAVVFSTHTVNLWASSNLITDYWKYKQFKEKRSEIIKKIEENL